MVEKMAPSVENAWPIVCQKLATPLAHARATCMTNHCAPPVAPCRPRLGDVHMVVRVQREAPTQRPFQQDRRFRHDLRLLGQVPESFGSACLKSWPWSFALSCHSVATVLPLVRELGEAVHMEAVWGERVGH